MAQPKTKKLAKIIATLGPASSEPETIRALIHAGVNVFRLNFSHGSHEDHLSRIKTIREIAEEMDCAIGILADLQGPKLRTGILKDHEPFMLETDSLVDLTAKEALLKQGGHQNNGSNGVITTPAKELVGALECGETILINDGKIKLEVAERKDDLTLVCKVIQGGLLEEKKGINVPQVSLSMKALTEKDERDALFCAKHEVDYLALSFVRRGEDIDHLIDFIKTNKLTPPPIIAKIEKPQALDDIDTILEKSQGIMVARGDLGVELPPEQVPIIQKKLAEQARLAEKPVIVATQMLESMVTSIQPTRAEVSDVANAIFDGADAVMLSGETAAGDFPVETVEMMASIIEKAEEHFLTYHRRAHEASNISSPHFYHAVAHSACYASLKADVEALVVLSTSGQMALRVSKLKPNRKIIALTPDKAVYNRLSLLWGVTPLHIPYGDNTDETLRRGEATILQHELLKAGDSVVFCAGETPFYGATNMLKLFKVGDMVIAPAHLLNSL